jgi:hypothetical protein
MAQRPPISCLRKLVLSIFLLLLLGFSTGFYFNSKKLLFPGPTSAIARKDEPLEGYTSHASFEQECAHCHAPIHCVTESRCQSCHFEIALQRASDTGLHSRLPGTSRCQNCHFEHQGREAVITTFAYHNVDHQALANFSLDKHQVDYKDDPLTCESCHSQDRFIHETLDCLTCHIQQDHEGMAVHIETYGSECILCHDGVDRYTGFDHDSYFLLEGSHLEADCASCHIDQAFFDTPRQCSGCHEEPEVHAGTFGKDCARCHGQEQWLPALLTQHDFILDHGGEEILDCHTCHSDNYHEITCYGCHDHTPEDMEEVHSHEEIEEYDDCRSCHPTGASGEARLLWDIEQNVIGP